MMEQGGIMLAKQRGITLVSFVIVLVVIGFFVYMGMVLGPSYSEYYGVVKSMKSLAAQSNAENADLNRLQIDLQKYFDVGYVESVQGTDLKLIRNKDTNDIDLNYEVRKPFIYNIDFVIKFDFTTPLGTNSTRE
jgi:Tfp pilus assembly protein PilE